MSFKVLRPGLLSSLQDIGRIGYQKYGINVSGAWMFCPYAWLIFWWEQGR
jgi:hypothetical protein